MRPRLMSLIQRGADFPDKMRIGAANHHCRAPTAQAFSTLEA
jgi:hypothetical protein